MRRIARTRAGAIPRLALLCVDRKALNSGTATTAHQQCWVKKHRPLGSCVRPSFFLHYFFYIFPVRPRRREMPGERRRFDLYLFVVSVSAAMVLCSCYRFEVHLAVDLPFERQPLTVSCGR